MDTTALMLSRLQFAFTVSFHIIFPSFTIGLAAWLTVLEALHLITGRPAYRRVFDFWLKIFGIAFGMGVVSGIVLAFEFGTNWSELSRLSGPIQGPLLSYETFTAFMLEASFFGVLLFGKSRVRPGFYLFSTAMVALGTTLSAFWRGWPHSFSGTRPPKNPASDFHRTRLAHSIKRRANAGLVKLHKPFANIASLIHSVFGTRTLNRRLPVSLKLPSIESRTRACDSCTTRKSAPFRVRAKFEPLCKPLQLAVRFLRILLPAPPTALLAVCLPSDDALWGWR